MLNSHLKERRKEARFSQLDLAEALGVSRPTYSSWEAGKSYPSIEQAYQLLAFYRGHRFDWTISDLFSEAS